MKKIFILLIISTSILLLVGSCEKENYPKPDAQFFGAIKDSLGGELVQSEIVNGNTIGAYQQGLATPVLITWFVQHTGEFRNNLVYSNMYDIAFTNVNFFPYEVKNFGIEPGANEHDFYVTPYIRIKNYQIVNNTAVDSTISVTFTLEAGRSTVKLSRTTLFAYSDMFVGNAARFTIAAGSGTPTRTYNPVATINPATTYTLSIDLRANRASFKPGKSYYFRVGVQASQTGVGTIRYNYAPPVKFTF